MVEKEKNTAVKEKEEKTAGADRLWQQLKRPLRPQLLKVEELLEVHTASRNSLLQEMVHYILKGGGKRLRPLLVLLCGSLEKEEENSELLKAAAAAELIHTASLVHDDIIDRSFERRGRPSLQEVWGNHAAVLAGDFLFARAFELIARCEDYELNRIFTRAIGFMCEGEVRQKETLYDPGLLEETYLHIIYCKTAALLEACCAVGGRIGRLEEGKRSLLGTYGRHLGLAFQVSDDVLDFVGGEGPSPGSRAKDLSEGVLTLPVLYLLQDAELAPLLKQKICNRELSPAELEFLFCSPACARAVERSLQRAAFYSARAVKAIDGLDHRGFPAEALHQVASFVSRRGREGCRQAALPLKFFRQT